MEELFEAERFYGRVHTLEMKGDWLASKYNASTGFTNYSTGDFGYCVVTIEPLGDAPPVVKVTSGTKGLYLGRTASGVSVGGTYRVTVRTGDYGSYPQQTLLTVNFQMSNANRPESGTPADGIFYVYPGSNDRYIWHITEPGLQESSIELVASPNRPVFITNLIFKSYSDTPKK